MREVPLLRTLPTHLVKRPDCIQRSEVPVLLISRGCRGPTLFYREQPQLRQPASQRDCGRLCFTLVTGPTRSLSLKLSDTRVYEPQIRLSGAGWRLRNSAVGQVMPRPLCV